MGEDQVPTPSQTVGPFFGYALPFEGGPDSAGGAEVIRIEGQLLDGAGEPVPDGLLELWGGQQFARCRTDAEGAFHFTVTKPPPGSEPGDEAPHLHVTVFARGLLRHLATRMYFPDEEAANGRDRVLNVVDPARRHTLIAQSDGAVLRFDIRMQGDSETVFFAL
ncbi:MAG TPA: protocatechuate 3,4-dioxygenase subunit alpha [Candidatus Dormibacteraeota bacterium]|nr:protocatechuate 3,4-dioxygenase subunit alpha [Candidatus Dormibacteraeota bacterium]